MQGDRMVFDFNPFALLACVEYGLTYCFMTPVFLFLLILWHPKVDDFAFRVTTFIAFLNGLLNLNDWFNPERVVMGMMYLPLLLLVIVALILPRTYLHEKFQNVE